MNMLNKIWCIISSSFIIFSCTEDIDFDQVQDLQINPVIESSLVYFNEKANLFLIFGNEIILYEEIEMNDLLNGEFINDNVIKAEFRFDTVSSINRNLEVQVDLFDNSSQIQHSFTFYKEASINNNDVFSSYIETFESNTLEALKRSTILAFTIRILEGPAAIQNSRGRVELKSLATFYLNIGDLSNETN